MEKVGEVLNTLREKAKQVSDSCYILHIHCIIITFISSSLQHWVLDYVVVL